MKKKHLLMWVFAVLAGMLFAAAPQVQGGGDEGRVSFGGAWLLTNPIGIRFVETITPLVPSGNRVVAQMTPLSADATGMGCCKGADYLSVGIGEGIRTGRSTLAAKVLAYSMKVGDLRDEVVCIWEINAEATFTEDTQEGVGSLTIIPSVDEDVDLLPDEGDVACIADLPLDLNAIRVPTVAP